MITIEELMKKYKGICFYCKRKIRGRLFPTREHVFPKSQGGENASINIVLACNECNSKKANKSIEEFLKEVNCNKKGKPIKGIKKTRRVKHKRAGDKRKKQVIYNEKINYYEQEEELC